MLKLVPLILQRYYILVYQTSKQERSHAELHYKQCLTND